MGQMHSPSKCSQLSSQYSSATWATHHSLWYQQRCCRVASKERSASPLALQVSPGSLHLVGAGCQPTFDLPVLHAHGWPNSDVQ